MVVVVVVWPILVASLGSIISVLAIAPPRIPRLPPIVCPVFFSWCQYWKKINYQKYTVEVEWTTEIEHTSKWLFACTDHSSLVENMRPHSSHDHESCWWVCGIVRPDNDEPLDWWWFCVWTILCATVDGVVCWIILGWRSILLFSLFSSFFLTSIMMQNKN